MLNIDELVKFIEQNYHPPNFETDKKEGTQAGMYIIKLFIFIFIFIFMLILASYSYICIVNLRRKSIKANKKGCNCQPTTVHLPENQDDINDKSKWIFECDCKGMCICKRQVKVKIAESENELPPENVQQLIGKHAYRYINIKKYVCMYMYVCVYIDAACTKFCVCQGGTGDCSKRTLERVVVLRENILKTHMYPN
jgi:hypothetical protein